MTATALIAATAYSDTTNRHSSCSHINTGYANNDGTYTLENVNSSKIDYCARQIF
jgi:hypothetical protein